jgi:predicted nucleotidyltransferase
MPEYIKNVGALVDASVTKISQALNPERIILFGSYAYGTPHEDSDVDLLVIQTTHDKFFKRGLRIRKLLSWEENAAISLLVLTPDEIAKRLERGDQFVAEILQRGKQLYASR